MSGGTTLGTAYVQIVPTAKGIKGAISDAIGGEAEAAGTSAGNKIGSFAKKAIAAAAIGTALVAGVKKAMSEASELEQNMGGAHAVFGDTLYSALEAKATEAYKNMGLSASNYYATANKMGSLFQGSGLSQQRSLELSTQAMQRAADVASVMGIDTSTAMESIAGAAKGNFTMMDNLGVAMNATTLSAYALEKGVNFNWNTASNAEKAELAMQMFMDRTTQYAGNFARESEETFSGSFGAMQASWENFMGNLALGENVSESLSSLVTTASTFFFNNFIPMLGTIIKSLPAAIGTFLTQGVPMLLSSISSLASSIGNSISNFAKSITGEKVAEWVSTTVPKILSSADSVMGNFITGILKNLGKVVLAIGKIGLAIVKGLGSALWGKVKAAAEGIKERFLTPINTLKDKVKGIIDKIKNFFSFKVSAPHIPLPHFSITPAGWKLGDLLKGVKPSLGISWYAEGGIFDRATVLPGIGVGEAGAEAILPLTPFWEKMDRIVDAFEHNSGNNVVINVYARDGQSSKEIAAEVERRIIRSAKSQRLAWQ